MINIPLAELARPKTIDDVVGQHHLLDKDKPLRQIIESGRIPNMIFYGPPGTGKTTVARVIADTTNMKMYKLNGTTASISDIRSIIKESDNEQVLLYLDEIQYLNKKQQQSLLEFIENGQITLIASTTENPYFYVFNAILSRSTVFEFKPVEPTDIVPAIDRAIKVFVKTLNADRHTTTISVENNVLETIASRCGGDVRKALNTIELSIISSNANGGSIYVSVDTAKQLTQSSSMKYDKNGDEHYNIISALQKSIRGSDENAALHYMARLIAANDLISLCRRLLVIAAEDIGLAYPMALPIVKSCVDSAMQLGLPEARIPLADAVILLATAPKSNSGEKAIDMALGDIANGFTGEIPRHLQNTHCDGVGNAVQGQDYKYPHDYPNHYVKQQYLPDELRDRVYYTFGDNRQEQTAYVYRQKILNS